MLYFNDAPGSAQLDMLTKKLLKAGLTASIMIKKDIPDLFGYQMVLLSTADWHFWYFVVHA